MFAADVYNIVVVNATRFIFKCIIILLSVRRTDNTPAKHDRWWIVYALSRGVVGL